MVLALKLVEPMLIMVPVLVLGPVLRGVVRGFLKSLHWYGEGF